MTFRGHIKNGQIIIESGVLLPEGAELDIRVARRAKKRASGPKRPKRRAAKPAPAGGSRKAKPRTLYERLKPFIGAVKDLPPDASRNLDHYLYGHPKRP